MPNIKKSVFIIAGEVSGDVLGAHIMAKMPDVKFIGVGGQNMQSVGLKSLFPISDLAVMGIIEVLLHARTLTKRIKQTVDAIIQNQPDIVLTIDSPGFAKAVISAIRKSKDGQNLIKNGVKFYHVVAPQVWAWRPKRAKKFAKLFDRLYTFFDFEVPYFTKYGLDTVAVGHPIADKILGKYNENNDNKYISLLPGSRITEVKKLLPIYRDFVSKVYKTKDMNNYTFVIPTVETTDKYVRSEVAKWKYQPIIVPATDRYDIFSKTYIAIVASGTVSVELAMMHKPAIVVYKMNAITMLIAKILVKVKWVSLVNILLNKAVYPELLGQDATVDKIYIEFNKLMNESKREKIIFDLHKADKLWRPDDKDVATRIANLLFR